MSIFNKSDAEHQYVFDLYNSENSATTTKTKYSPEIVTSIEFGNIFMIRLNRPKKFNAMTGQMYQDVAAALKEADQDPSVIACCMTGNGEYYSSGNDLSNYTGNMMEGDVEAKIKEGCDMCGNFVLGFIEFSKPLIALVNGPAVGISFTVLGLFDMVISSDKANFSAPFTKIALSPEGCSSYVFPRLMGKIRAADVLMFNKKLTAGEAFNYGIITEVIASREFEEKSMERLQTISKLPKESLIAAKSLMLTLEKDTLKKVNDQEMKELANRLMSGEFMESVMAFMSKKSKL